MDKIKDILTTEIFPKKHDWLLSAFSFFLGIALGFLAMPYWRMSILMLLVASGNFTHVEKHFRGKRFVSMLVFMAGTIVTLCFFLLVRTGYVGEDSIVMVATAVGWLGIIVIQCATLVYYLVRTRHSKKRIDADNQ